MLKGLGVAVAVAVVMAGAVGCKSRPAPAGTQAAMNEPIQGVQSVGPKGGATQGDFSGEFAQLPVGPDPQHEQQGTKLGGVAPGKLAPKTKGLSVKTLDGGAKQTASGAVVNQKATGSGSTPPGNGLPDDS